MIRRFARKLIFGFLLCSAWALLPGQSAPVRAILATARHDAATAPHSRILAKFIPPYAETLEAALPGSLSFAAASATAPEAQAFMARYHLTALSPLYRDLVAAKIQRHVSADQLAEEVREKYPARARRLRAVFHPPDISRTWVLELQDPAQFASTRAALKSDPNIEYAEEDGTASTVLTPNDPYYASSGTWGQPYYDLWGIHRINASSAWDTSTGGGVVVAVVDTGIDYHHPDLAANVAPGASWNYVSDVPDATDDNGHGTHVSGTIAAVGNNGLGVIGVAWNAKILAVKGLNSDGLGADSALALCLEYAAHNGADVINNSWGGGYSQTIADAIDYAYNLGAVIVVAAGNSASDVGTFYPANLWDVITVAASDPDDGQAFFSNFGQKIDVAAPGLDILSLQASGTALGEVVTPGYMRLSGTSMAAPHVSGLAALILAQHPDYSNEDVRQAIRTSATPLGTAAPPGSDNFDPNFGYGRIDCARAMAVGPVLEAKISSPANGGAYTSSVQVSGVARGAGLTSWVLEYALSTNLSARTILATGTGPVAGALGTFEAGRLADGSYIIRLTAFNAAGNAFTDRTGVLVETAAISSPLAGLTVSSSTTFKNGAVVRIMGTAIGDGFQSYQVEWAPQTRPDNLWQTTGITLAGGGLSTVSSGLLAQWDTSSITKAGYYSVRLTETSSYFTNTLVTSVYLEPDLYSTDWPRWLASPPTNFPAGPAPAMNGDGSTRLMVSGWQALWSLPLTGAAPPEITTCCSSYAGPSIADLSGTGAGQAILGNDTNVTVVAEDGTQQTFSPTGFAQFELYPIEVTDLFGDSRLETLAAGADSTGLNLELYAWLPGGAILNNNFPILAGDQASIGLANTIRFIAADINGDGKKEIVLPSDLTDDSWTLWLFGGDGSLLKWNNPESGGMPLAMAAADLDNNGTLETIVASSSFIQGTSFLHVFQPDGTERPGWPIQLSGQYFLSGLFLAVGDLNRDGQKEIVISAGGQLYVFTNAGTPYSAVWPLTTPYSGIGYGSLALADIDGDGYPEIVSVFTQPGSSGYLDETLLAVRRDGTVARSWPLTGMMGYLPVDGGPTVGDFDNDGLTEIAVTYGVDYIFNNGHSATLAGGVATLLKTGAPYNPAVNDWPMVFHDARNSAVLPAGAPACTYGVAPWPLKLSGPAASGSFNVQATSASCQWNAASDSPWLTLTSAFASGSGGAGTVSYTASANHNAVARTAHVTVGSQTFLVTQTADTLPQYALTVLVEPAGAGTAGPGGSYESGTNVCLTETAAEGWTFAAWSGLPALTGSCFIITANTTVTASFTTSGCTYTLDANDAHFGPAGGTGQIGVTVNNPACQWGVSSDAPWVIVTSATTAIGNGSVQYTISANTTRSERTARLNIAGEDFTITQRSPIR